MREPVVVVLGTPVESRAVPPELRGRMDVGLAVYRRNDACALVCAGGYTTPGVAVAESEAMEAYAVRRGVDPDRIRVDLLSQNTVENAYYTRRIVDGLQISTVHVATSCFHVERARFVFERVYGDEYEVIVDHCHPSDRSPSEIYESEAMAAARTFFDPIDDGDLDAIDDRLTAYDRIRATS